MIQSLFILVAKILASLLLLIFLRMIWMELKVKKQLKRLCAQGMQNFPGNETFFVGPNLKIEKEYFKRVKHKEPIPVRF